MRFILLEKMDEERTYVNLRLLGEVGKHQFITTTSNYNILGIVDDTFINNIITGLRMDNFSSTNTVLKRLYTTDAKLLVNTLINEKNTKSLTNLMILLYKARIGLENLKDIYDYNSLYRAHFNSLIFDYANMQISKVEQFLDKSAVKYTKYVQVAI